jgi:hypothetical protein
LPSSSRESKLSDDMMDEGSDSDSDSEDELEDEEDDMGDEKREDEGEEEEEEQKGSEDWASDSLSSHGPSTSSTASPSFRRKNQDETHSMEEDDRVEDEFFDTLGSSGVRSATKNAAIVSPALSGGMMTSLDASRANTSSNLGSSTSNKNTATTNNNSGSGGSKSADAIKSEYKQYWLKHRAGTV